MNDLEEECCQIHVIPPHEHQSPNLNYSGIRSPTAIGSMDYRFIRQLCHFGLLLSALHVTNVWASSAGRVTTWMRNG